MSIVELSFSGAIRETLRFILSEDPKSFLMGEDIGRYGGAFKITEGFLDEFGPSRIIETPISEAGIVGLACGAAMAGSRPIVEIMFMDFLLLALDPIVNVAIKWSDIYGPDFNIPLLIRTPAGGGKSYGPTHSQSFEGLLANIPHLQLICPSSAQEAAQLLWGAYLSKKTTIFIEPKALYPRKEKVDLSQFRVPIMPGKARIIQEGSDLTIITYGRWVSPALQTAETLRIQANYQIEILDLRSLKPLDMATILHSVSKTGRVLIIEESPLFSGIGAEIAAQLASEAFGFLEAPVLRLGAEEKAIPMSPTLESQHFPTVSKILEAAKYVLTF